MTEYKYLDDLIDEVRDFRDKTIFLELDTTKCCVSYMSRKNTSFVGLKQGYSELLIRNQNRLKELDKLRSTAKDYLKFIKNEQGELIQIESYKKGLLDCIFQVHWIGNVRYLIPFSNEGGFYPTYTYVTKYEKYGVVEEYMVQGKQIIHESYSENLKGKIDYSYINYVSDGNHPVREVRKGIFSVNPLTYVERFNDNWLNHR